MTALAGQAWRAVLRTQLLLALLVFGAAWSLRYWQAWLYWAIFAGASLINTGYFLRHAPALVRRRLAAGPAAEAIRRQRLIQACSGVSIGAILVVAGLDHRFHWSSVAAASVLAADAAFVLALLLIFRVFRENAHAASTVRVEPGQPVIASGCYGWVRHPMYAGSAIAFVATPVALGSTWACVAAVPACAALVARLLDEESHLQRDLAGYRAYCGRVRFRLIPGIW